MNAASEPRPLSVWQWRSGWEQYLGQCSHWTWLGTHCLEKAGMPDPSTQPQTFTEMTWNGFHRNDLASFWSFSLGSLNRARSRRTLPWCTVALVCNSTSLSLDNQNLSDWLPIRRCSSSISSHDHYNPWARWSCNQQHSVSWEAMFGHTACGLGTQKLLDFQDYHCYCTRCTIISHASRPHK